MVDLLVALAQAVCVCGLAYGAYLCIRYSDAFRDREPAVRQEDTWLGFPVERKKREPEAVASLRIERDTGERPHVGA